MANQKDTPKVSVIILNYKRPKDTIDCVQSVLNSHYSNLEVIVVDNGPQNTSSSNLLQEELKSRGLLFVRAQGNLGYAGGNNLGIRCSQGQYILILNDDVIVGSDLIEGLVAIAERNDNIGIIGPTIFRYGSQDVWFWSSNILHRDGAILDVPFVLGAVFMIKRQVIQRIGLLDENFFLYHEEWDWCVRARQAGFRTVCATSLSAWHKVPTDEKSQDYLPPRAYFFHRNFFLFAGKHCKNVRTAFGFLFKHLIYHGDLSFPSYYVIDALKRRKVNVLKPYSMAFLDGAVFFLKFRLSNVPKKESIVGA